MSAYFAAKCCICALTYICICAYLNISHRLCFKLESSLENGHFLPKTAFTKIFWPFICRIFNFWFFEIRESKLEKFFITYLNFSRIFDAHASMLFSSAIPNDILPSSFQLSKSQIASRSLLDLPQKTLA